MDKLDLERVMAQEPTLNTIGFGLSNIKRYSPEEYKKELAANRDSLLAQVELCSKVADWLKANVQQRATINSDRGSYGWKHVVEQEIGKYVPNGAFIAAAIYCGFKYKIAAPGSPNAYFNIRTYKPEKVRSYA